MNSKVEHDHIEMHHIEMPVMLSHTYRYEDATQVDDNHIDSDDLYREDLPIETLLHPTTTMEPEIKNAAHKRKVEHDDEQYGKNAKTMKLPPGGTVDQGRPEVHDAHAVANMAAMLRALVDWTQKSPKCDSLSANGWVFENPEHQADFNAVLNDPKIHASINAMLSTRVMQVTASSEVADIEARTAGWGFDIEGLRKAANSGPSLITCASLELNAQRWPGSFASGGGYPTTGWADAATLVIPVCLPKYDGDPDTSCFYRDARGLVVFKYHLRVSGHNVSVVLTHIPFSYQKPFTLTQLVTEHASAELTPLIGAEYSACAFHSIKVRVGTESLRPIQGIKQGSAQIIALQGQGYLQFNKSTPLNLTCQSVAVMRFRGKKPKPPPAYEMFELGPDGKVRFNNSIEVQVDGRTVFATMTTFKDTTDAGS